jgi:hypothetical protein
MNRHPYLRAYMAGIVVPTVGLLVMLSAFIAFCMILQVPVPVERAIAFPMAIVPNLWGVWNMLYVRLRQTRPWKIGIHGILLPVLVIPLGFVLGKALGILETTPEGLVYFGAIHLDYAHWVTGIWIGIAMYYLAWKYVVNFFNELLGIA